MTDDSEYRQWSPDDSVDDEPEQDQDEVLNDLLAELAHRRWVAEQHLGR